MAPVDAFRFLEIAAERIKEGPQTDKAVRDALNALRGHVARWRLNWLWEHLQVDASSSAIVLTGASQNLNAALNGIASDLRQERLGPVAMAEAVRRARAG